MCGQRLLASPEIAGSANGLDYFRSVPLAFFGSWSWENFGETYRPSLNDWFMTSFGGITLGEVFHRVGATIRDNRATGMSRFMREVAALPVDPIGGVNRVVRGEWTARGPNPPDDKPTNFVLPVGGLKTCVVSVSNGVEVRGW